MIMTWKSALSALTVAASLQLTLGAAEPATAPVPMEADHHLDGCRPCGWLGGASFDLLRPYFSDNTSFTVFATTPAGGGFISAGNGGREFEWSHEPAFSAWLGWAGDSGLG